MATTVDLHEQAHLLIEQARSLRDRAGLTHADIARATGAKPATVRSWLAGTHGPAGERAERLLELTAIVEHLLEVFKPEYVALWLRTPIPALGYEKPLDVILASNYMRVAELVSELESAPAI